MATLRQRTVIGIALVLLGLLQTILFAIQGDWIPTGLGLIYAGLGVMYLWAEVYTGD